MFIFFSPNEIEKKKENVYGILNINDGVRLKQRKFLYSLFQVIADCDDNSIRRIGRCLYFTSLCCLVDIFNTSIINTDVRLLALRIEH